MPTALIAEDEPLLARTLRTELAALWPELDIADEASNGDDAIDALSARDFDIAFLDISMPGRNGLEVARHAMTLDPAPAVVFVTAHDSEIDRVVAQRLTEPTGGTPRSHHVDRLIHATSPARRHMPPERRTQVFPAPEAPPPRRSPNSNTLWSGGFDRSDSMPPVEAL